MNQYQPPAPNLYDFGQPLTLVGPSLPSANTQLQQNSSTQFNSDQHVWNDRLTEDEVLEQYNGTTARDLGVDTNEHNFGFVGFLKQRVTGKVKTRAHFDEACTIIKHFCESHNFGNPEIPNSLNAIPEWEVLKEKRVCLVGVLLKLITIMPPSMKEEITIPQLMLKLNFSSYLRQPTKRKLLRDVDSTLAKYSRGNDVKTVEKVQEVEFIELSDEEDAPAPAPDNAIFWYPPEVTHRNRIKYTTDNVVRLCHPRFYDSTTIDVMVHHILLSTLKKNNLKIEDILYCNTFTTFFRKIGTAFSADPFTDVELAQLGKNCTNYHNNNKSIDVFEKKLILMQINLESHWILGVVANPAGAQVTTDSNEPPCTVFFLDPMGSLIQARGQRFRTVVEHLLRAKGEIHPERVVLQQIKNLPVQDNWFDCGPYFIHFVEGIMNWRGGFLNIEDYSALDWHDWHTNPYLTMPIMREKVYRTILSITPPEKRHLICVTDRNNRQIKVETDPRPFKWQATQTASRRSRSADVSKKPRHRSIYPRFFSAEDFVKTSGQTDFTDPRLLTTFPISQIVRAKSAPFDFIPIFTKRRLNPKKFMIYLPYH